MQPQQSSSSKHIQPTEVPESLLDPIITKIWYELQDSTHRQPQQILHNISHCLNQRQKGVNSPVLLAINSCIHSSSNGQACGGIGVGVAVEVNDVGVTLEVRLRPP